MSKHVVASVSEMPSGSRKLVTVRGRPIALFNVKGEFFALIDKCPHMGGSLCKGSFTGLVESAEPGDYRYSREGEILRCPWHGWDFDIRTGQSYFDPTKVQAKQYKVAVEPGKRVAEGPYVAETVPVSVEEDYIVVEM